MDINLKEIYTLLFRVKRVYFDINLRVKALTVITRRDLFLSLIINSNTYIFETLQNTLKIICN